MAAIMNKKPGTLKFFLFLSILIIVGAVITIFVTHRQEQKKQKQDILPNQDAATVSINKVRQTATKDGLKEWSLNAESVQYMDSKKKAVFNKLLVTFFLKEKKKVYLSADQGILKTDSTDIEVTGNVILQNENCRLESEKLNYNHKKRIIFSKVPVKIISDAFDFVADSMSFDLNTNRTLLEGSVEGTFSENIDL